MIPLRLEELLGTRGVQIIELGPSRRERRAAKRRELRRRRSLTRVGMARLLWIRVRRLERQFSRLDKWAIVHYRWLWDGLVSQLTNFPASRWVDHLLDRMEKIEPQMA